VDIRSDPTKEPLMEWLTITHLDNKCLSLYTSRGFVPLFSETNKPTPSQLWQVRTGSLSHICLSTNLIISFFMFCWPCTSIYSLKEKPTWCTTYLQYISSNTSTCFGFIYSPSSGATSYGYNNRFLLFHPYNVLLYDGYRYPWNM